MDEFVGVSEITLRTGDTKWRFVWKITKGEAQVIPGVSDKRCLLRLSELSSCFKLGRRENATLSERLREGWDGDPIQIPNRKSNGLSTTDYAISQLGDITPGVIRKVMEGGTEGFDGHANRYLWAAVRSSRFLPMGGNIQVLTPYLDRLRCVLAKAKQAGQVWLDADAEKLWHEVYPGLKTSGDTVPHTDRGRPYALRLAMLYALADGTNTISLEHLKASLALWSYCRASAKLIFQSQPQGEPDPLWLQFLNAIREAPGINRSGLREVVGHKMLAEEIEKALGNLEAKRLAYRKILKPDGGGRPAECWFPGSGENDNPSPSSPEGGREGTNPNCEEFPAQAIGEGTNSSSDCENMIFPYSEGRELTPQADTLEWHATQELVSSLPQPAEGKGTMASSSEKKKGVVIPTHYPSAESWVNAVYQAGGKIIRHEDGHCILCLSTSLEAEWVKPILEDEKHWLHQACSEFLTEVEFMAELDAK